MSRSFILLCISLFTWGLGEGLFFFFQPIYLAQLGADTMTIASVYSAFAVAMMAAHIPAGYLADRLGRKPLLVAAWGVGMIATWVMAFSTSLPFFIGGMLMYGLTGFVSSPLNSYVTAERGRLQPARAMTFMSAAYNFGAVIGPLTGGWVGDRVGLRLVYFIAAGLFMISTSFVFFLRAQPREPHDPEVPVPGLLRNSRFVGFLGVVFLVMFVTYLPQPLTARFLEQERSLSLGNIGILGSMNGLGNAVFNLLLGQFRPQVGMLLVQVCVAAFTLAIWQGTGLGWYMAGYFLLGGHRTVRAFFFSTVRALIHPAQMGLAYGISETFSSSAMVLAPLLAGFVYTRDPAAVYPLSLGLIVLATLVVIAFMPRKAGELTPRVEPTLEP